MITLKWIILNELAGKITLHRVRRYLWEVFAEEGLFRVLLLGLLAYWNPFWAVIISSFVFGLCHFIDFKWQMVIASVFLGIILGGIYIWIPRIEVAYLACILIHFCIGMIGIWTGITKRWLK